MDGELTTLTLTIPNDATGYREEVAGRYVKIASATVASVLLQFDNGILRRVWPGDCYPGPQTGFKTIRIVSDLGACTVVLHTSPESITGSDALMMTAMAASLVNIEQEISGGGAPTQLADLLLPASPAAGAQIFAANAAETEIEITVPRSNAGTVYLGITAARCTAVDKFCTLGPGGIWYSNRAKHAVFGSGSDAFQVVNGKVI